MLKFKYKKANGEVSDRVGLIVKPAEKNDLMLDLTDLTLAERYDMEQLWKEYNEKLLVLQAEYSVFKKYMKNFKPEGIFDREAYEAKEV